MWISDKWTEYELLDCSDGERLERWGEYYLVRPDPQVIWRTPKEHPRWYTADARYERSASGGGRWRKQSREPQESRAQEEPRGPQEPRGQEVPQGPHESREQEESREPQEPREQRIPASWLLRYGDLAFNVSLMNFKHTGLFPEQAVNWEYIKDKIGEAGRRISVLNLFAYTGGSTLAAAAAGADVCHVDAARGMVQRARENAAASGLQDRPVRWIVDDCGKFIEREIKRGRRYDALVMDPPSYGRGPSGEVWKLEDDIYDLMKLCAGVLSDAPLFVLINSYTTGLSPSTIAYMARSLLGGRAVSDELGLPVTSSGKGDAKSAALPCGAACRWEP